MIPGGLNALPPYLLRPGPRCTRAPRAARADDCADANAVPTSTNLPEVRAAILCLHNRAREKSGLPPLKEDAKLRKAANEHSAEMVRDRFFGHGDFVERLLESGYADDRWDFGENLAWGAGDISTPQALMTAWLDSPGQRKTILTKGFRHLGIGLKLGLPTDPTVGITVTTDFGDRG